MRGTATGQNDIHNEHLKHMPDNYRTWLLQLYNKSLRSGMLPTVWQPAIIIPLHKPNKPLTSVDSYRPISLLSCVQKLMERLIVSRLTFFLEQKGVFRKTQGGYRMRLSAIDRHKTRGCNKINTVNFSNFPTKWLLTYYKLNFLQRDCLQDLSSIKSGARALFTNVNLQIPACNAAPLVSPLPSWFKVETYICTDFFPTSVSSQTNQNVLQMYHKLIDTNNSGYTYIFNAGSCIVETTCYAFAAVVISSRGATINFKLRPQIHIMECELIAINEALQWILLNNCQEEKYVIFSDSLSSLHLIQNTRPKNYLPFGFNLQDKLFNIASSHWVYLQFILGHKGIPGNKAADEAVKNAHLLRYRSLTPLMKLGTCI
ncbi:Ribonuclease H domain [Trinorchestia longiramus]|nr:Ribonuclease H domain [Trinorchestia longiramus]